MILLSLNIFAKLNNLYISVKNSIIWKYMWITIIGDI